MGNCLKTQLKAVVNNNNPIYNTLELKIKSQESGTSFLVSDHSLTNLLGNNYESNYDIGFKGGGFLCDASGVAQENGAYFSDGDYTLVISPKYSITKLNVTGEDTGGLSRVIDFNFSNIKYCTNLTELNVSVQTNRECSGSDLDLVNLTGLTKLSIKNVLGATFNIDRLFANLLENGFSDTLKFIFIGVNGNVTYNGTDAGTTFQSGWNTFTPVSSTQFTVVNKAGTLNDTWVKGPSGWHIQA